jgi:conjugative transfer signal peptidase TraF
MNDRSRRAVKPLAFGLAAIALIALPAVATMPTKLIWNVSASVQTGLYVLTNSDDLRRGSVVAVQPPPVLAKLMNERQYLGVGAPMLKSVAALPGDKVCRKGTRVSVNGHTIARAKKRDKKGLALPVWRGCQRLSQDQIFLVNAGVADSMDGRYFGPLPRNTVIGKAHLLMQAGPEIGNKE